MTRTDVARAGKPDLAGIRYRFGSTHLRLPLRIPGIYDVMPAERHGDALALMAVAWVM